MEKVILVGLGEFGSVWYKTLNKLNYIDLIAVDKEESNLEITNKDNINTYLSLEQAVKSESPDFVINATPPAVHNQINNIAFDSGIPVLSEKPIADNYFNAVQIAEISERKEVPFAIAENYRNFPIVETTKEYISEGRIGDIRTIDIDFRKNFKTDKDYFNKLENPLLSDVAIHHFDLIRYLTENEVSAIFAKNFNPKGSRFTGNAGLHTFMELENNVIITYNGNLVAKEQETDRLGDWRIEGSKGVLELSHHQLKIIKNGEVKEEKSLTADLYLEAAVKQFIEFIETGEEAKSPIDDYVKTQALVNFAKKSSTAGKLIQL